jgi:hypothetical protein
LRARHVGKVAKQENRMNRRQFAKIAAALASLLAAPFGATAASHPLPAKEERPPPTVTRLRIGTHKTADIRRANRLAHDAGQPQPWPDPPDDENNYWADLIKDGDQHFYRVGETAVEISEFEYGCVLANPNMYYFSQTLKVYVRLLRARESPAAQVRVTDFMHDFGGS